MMHHPYERQRKQYHRRDHGERLLYGMIAELFIIM